MTEDHGSEIGYTDASAFVRLLETEGRVRMLDVLLGKHYTTLTVSGIAELAEVHETTVYRNIQKLEDADLVRSVGTPDGPAQYQLNKSNEAARLLQKFHGELLTRSSDLETTTNKKAGPDLSHVPESRDTSISQTERKVANSVTKGIRL